MTTKKQIASTKSKVKLGIGLMAVKRPGLVIGSVIILLIAVLCVWHFIVQPGRDRERFEKAERSIAATIAVFNPYISVSQEIRRCQKTGEKLNNGTPFCVYEVSFNIASDSGYDSDEVLAQADKVMGLAFPIIKTGIRGHSYTDGYMGCILEPPSIEPKNGPHDNYTLHCDSNVTRYVY